MKILIIVLVSWASSAIVRKLCRTYEEKQAARLYLERRQREEQAAQELAAYRQQQIEARAKAARLRDEERARKARESARQRAEKAEKARFERQQAEADLEHMEAIRQGYMDLMDALEAEARETTTTAKRRLTIQRQLLQLEEKLHKIDTKRAKAYYLVKGAC